MAGVDQRWMTRLGTRDPLSSGFNTAQVQRNRDYFESEWEELLADCLPDRQVKTAASPGSPRQEQDFRTAQCGQVE
jgi:hypothetical protein